VNALAAIGVAGLIAVVGALWFLTSPVVVVKVEPIRPNPHLPSLQQVQERLR
jgi:hypothetical protein